MHTSSISSMRGQTPKLKFTPKEPSVAARHRSISSFSLAGVRDTEAVIVPWAPALATAAANFQSPRPAIAPWRIGYLHPNSSVILVFITQPPSPSGQRD